MTDNELLLAISNMMDEKIQPVKLLIENDVLPRLQNIESCYTSTYKRYENGSQEIDALRTDVKILKDVVTEHSKILQKIS